MPFAIDADLDLVVSEHIRKVRTDELAALVRVEDLRTTVGLDGFFKRLNTEARIQDIGATPLGLPRAQMACSKASKTSSVRIFLVAFQPTSS